MGCYVRVSSGGTAKRDLPSEPSPFRGPNALADRDDLLVIDRAACLHYLQVPTTAERWPMRLSQTNAGLQVLACSMALVVLGCSSSTSTGSGTGGTITESSGRATSSGTGASSSSASSGGKTSTGGASSAGRACPRPAIRSTSRCARPR